MKGCMENDGLMMGRKKSYEEGIIFCFGRMDECGSNLANKYMWIFMNYLQKEDTIANMRGWVNERWCCKC